MEIAKKHSHLNGEEWLLVHEPELHHEILDCVALVNAEKCKTKISEEKRKLGNLLYNPRELNAEFDRLFCERGWKPSRYSYYIAHDYQQLETMTGLSLAKQKDFLLSQDAEAIRSYNQTDHVKSRVAVEVQFGKYAFVAYDLFVKHLAFYTGRQIEVGVEILPTRAMQQQMSSGISYYEGELHNILRHGRTSPPVPLVILGIEP